MSLWKRLFRGVDRGRSVPDAVSTRGRVDEGTETPVFVPYQSFEIELSGMASEFLSRPGDSSSPTGRYLAGLQAFVHAGDLFLLDGEARRFSSGPRGLWQGTRQAKPTHHPFPSAPPDRGRFSVKGEAEGDLVIAYSVDHTEVLYRWEGRWAWQEWTGDVTPLMTTPSLGSSTWHPKAIEYGELILGPIENGRRPGYFGHFSPCRGFMIRCSTVGDQMIGVCCEPGRARALRWTLDHDPLLMCLPAQDSVQFTGRVTERLFARSEDGTMVMMADEVEVGGSSGRNRSVYRLRTKDRVFTVDQSGNSRQPSYRGAPYLQSSELDAHLPLNLTWESPGIATWAFAKTEEFSRYDHVWNFKVRVDCKAGTASFVLQSFTDS